MSGRYMLNVGIPGTPGLDDIERPTLAAIKMAAAVILEAHRTRCRTFGETECVESIDDARLKVKGLSELTDTHVVIDVKINEASSHPMRLLLWHQKGTT